MRGWPASDAQAVRLVLSWRGGVMEHVLLVTTASGLGLGGVPVFNRHLAPH